MILSIADAVISIHAPVKGATPFLAGLRSAALISIHAPVKGATFPPLAACTCQCLISIHAPVKGATRRCYR